MNVEAQPILENFHFLPDNSLIPIVLLRRQITLTNQKTQETYKACAVTLVADVEDPNLKNKFIKDKRIGVICTKNNQVKFVTICPEMLDALNKSNIKGITILMGERVYVLDRNANFKSFVSEEQYKKFIAKI